MIKALRHTCVVVEDIDKALKFYVDLLGFTVINQEIIEGDYPSFLFNIKDIKLTYIKIQIPGDSSKIELYYFHQPQIYKSFTLNHFAITVDNLLEEYNRLLLAGVEFVSPPQLAPDNPCMVCFCSDPDGNMIELVEDLK